MSARYGADGVVRTPYAWVSLDAESGRVLVSTPLGEVRLSKQQLDVLAVALVRPADVSVELSAALHFTALAGRHCVVCESPQVVDTNTDGEPVCLEHKRVTS